MPAVIVQVPWDRIVVLVVISGLALGAAGCLVLGAVLPPGFGVGSVLRDGRGLSVKALGASGALSCGGSGRSGGSSCCLRHPRGGNELRVRGRAAPVQSRDR